MRTFDDHDQLSRVSFDETTLERAQFVRETVAQPFRLRCVDILELDYLLREVSFWQRYTGTEGR